MSSKLKIISDIDCQIYCDYEYVGDAVSGKLFHLNLRKGIYLLEFKKDTVVLATQRYKMESNDEEDLLEISLLDIYNNLQREERREKIKNLSVIWFHTGDNWRIGSTKDEILNPETTETWIDLPSSYVLLPMGQHIDPDVDCCGYIPFNIGGTLHSDDLVGYSITGGMWGCINQIGEVTIPPIYESKVFFKNDQVTTIIENKVRKETINYLGEIAFKELGRIRPIDEAQGLYETIKENQHGLINKYGQYLIHPDYDELQYVGENCIWAKGVDSKRWGVLNINSDIVLPFVYSSIHKAEGGYYVCCNGLWGSVSDNGTIVTNPNYKVVAKFKISDYKEGLLDDDYDYVYKYFSIVKKKEKYGIINTDFESLLGDNVKSVDIQEIVPCIYDAIYSKDGNKYSDEELVELCLPQLGWSDGLFRFSECYFVSIINGELECSRYGLTRINNLDGSFDYVPYLENSFKCEEFNHQYMVKSKKYHFINEKSCYDEESYDLISNVAFYDGTFDYQPNPDGWDGYSAPTEYIKVKNTRSYPIAKKDDTWYVFNNTIPRSVLFSCKCEQILEFGNLVCGECFAIVERDNFQYLYIIDDEGEYFETEAYREIHSSYYHLRDLKISLDDKYHVNAIHNDYFIAEDNDKKYSILKWYNREEEMEYYYAFSRIHVIDEYYAEVEAKHYGRTIYNTVYTGGEEIKANAGRWRLSSCVESNSGYVAEYDAVLDKEGIVLYSQDNSEGIIFEPFAWDYARIFNVGPNPIIAVGNYINGELRCGIKSVKHGFITEKIFSNVSVGENLCKKCGCVVYKDEEENMYYCPKCYNNKLSSEVDRINNTIKFDLQIYKNQVNAEGKIPYWAYIDFNNTDINPYYSLPFLNYKCWHCDCYGENYHLAYENPFRFIRIYIDLETTGLPLKRNEPYTNLENWPYVVQAALIIEDADHGILAKRDIIVRPENYTIPESSSNIHGISTQYALENGEERKDVFGFLDLVLSKSQSIVGHNLEFDLNVLKAEIIRTKGLDNVLFDKVKPHLDDTMVRGKSIMYNLKYPKLDELYYMLFNKHFDNQHNAMADVEATYECYKELLRLGIYR